MRMLLCCLVGFLPLALSGQTRVGLVAHYLLDGNLKDNTGNTSNDALTTGNPSYVCGAVDNAISLRGAADQISILGPVNGEFDTEDFTVSFYFKVGTDAGIQYLLSKRRSDCLIDNAFFIRYRPATRNINIYLGEGEDRVINMVQELPKGRCWYHISVAREGTRLKLYVDGELVQELRSVGRVNVLNDGKLIVGGSTCYGANETAFTGLLDDLRFYNRSLRDSEARGLYTPIDRITTEPATIFLGEEVQLELGKTCATGFQWSPALGIANVNEAEPLAVPPVTGTLVYTVRLQDASSPCVAVDSVRISVIDPSTLDCGEVFLPKAFSPNGDGLNDTYGISNPRAIPELITFEIYDRWGARIFATTNPLDQWDGSINGQEANPGVMRYLVRYRCQGEEKVATGSLVIMR